MPIEDFQVRKTTEHVGVQSQQLVLSDLPTTTSSANLYVDGDGIVYKAQPYFI